MVVENFKGRFLVWVQPLAASQPSVLLFWQGLFPSLEAFKVCLRSLVGDGNSTLFWFNNWYDGQAPKHQWRYDFFSTTFPLVTFREFLVGPISNEMRHDLTMADLTSRFNSSSRIVLDQKSWKLIADGVFNVHSFYRFLIDRGLRCSVTLVIIRCPVPRKIASFSWLAWDYKILTLDTLFARG
ncbi:hypothetical protein IHE45_02G031500 [Dioscorea alata]|uniref:Uncharacterized protein n=1 Tax=Dioscorea alata TaxID=55571 RepID=A0ACB7WNW0_DIOAL|nr:hypothetical protein IHE45_02G031500 [Dioscorea alata]